MPTLLIPLLSTERSAELSRCFSGQPPQRTDRRTSLDHENDTPESHEPEFSDRGAPAGAPPPLTDMERGPVQSDSRPGSQTQTPSGRISLLALCYTDGFWCWKVNLVNSPVGLRNTDRYGNCCCVAVGQWFSAQWSSTTGGPRGSR